MMGSNRTNEKDNPPASANPLMQAHNDYSNSIAFAPNIQAAHGVNFREGNVSSGGHFGSFPDIPLPVAPNWENMYLMNQSTNHGFTETSGNPMPYFMNHPNSFQNTQIDLCSNIANTNLSEAESLLPELNMGWGPQFINQGHNVNSSGGMNNRAGSSNFENPIRARNFAGDLQMFNTRNNLNFNSSQNGVQGKVEGSFLSLGIGGNEEATPTFQAVSNSGSNSGSREISDQLKEAAAAELKMGRARRALGQTLDPNFVNFQRNTNQLGHVDRMSSINTSGSNPYNFLQMQPNDDSTSSFLSSRNTRFGDLDHYRDFLGNQDSNSGTFGTNSAQFLNSRQHDLNRLATPSGQLQNTRFRSPNSLPSECLNRQNYAGQQLLSQNSMPTQGIGGSLHPQRNTSPQVAWVNSGQTSTDAPFPKRLGVEINRRDIPQPAETLKGTNLQTTNTGQIFQFPDKTSTRLQDHLFRHSIDCTDRGAPVNHPLNIQEPFLAHGQSQNAMIQLPKDPRGAASTNGQSPNAMIQLSKDLRGATSINGQSPNAMFQLSKDPRGATSTNVPSQNAVIQLPKDPRGAASTNASTISGLPHVRAYHKRSAAAPPPASQWVQRQKITPPPTINHSLPIPIPSKPHIPLTIASQPQPVAAVPVINPSIPCSTNVIKPRIPVTSVPPSVSHITWKEPDANPQLSGHKCFLCKRDLSLTSEGAVYQPSAPPPVAILPCGHTFHDQCLHNITPRDQSKDPPCIPCAIGEN